MRVFVTGATGFIGTALSLELLSAGHHVTGLARNEAASAKLDRLGVAVHRGVLEEPETVSEGVRQADGVIHLAYDTISVGLPRMVKRTIASSARCWRHLGQRISRSW